MNKIDTFEQFLATSKGNIGMSEFIFGILLAALLSFILAFIYVKFGNSLSNRKQFAANFIIITLTTMVIISIVKSSLALSLGLVGALSIVRFRTAIKEPEELSYMFLSIAVGLGFGANQTNITVGGFIVIVSIIVVRGLFKKNDKDTNFFITLNSDNSELNIDDLTKILSKHCSKAAIRRIDDSESSVEIVLLVEFGKSDKLQGLRNDLRKYDSKISFSIMENKGLV
ncbi:MAG: DUF4956 domain-containing protein [Spirochaetes bacterium]|nr:DUF4956 domain-containing protein [Spirochaetota bacterium]